MGYIQSGVPKKRRSWWTQNSNTPRLNGASYTPLAHTLGAGPEMCQICLVCVGWYMSTRWSFLPSQSWFKENNCRVYACLCCILYDIISKCIMICIYIYIHSLMCLWSINQLIAGRDRLVRILPTLKWDMLQVMLVNINVGKHTRCICYISYIM